MKKAVITLLALTIGLQASAWEEVVTGSRQRVTDYFVEQIKSIGVIKIDFARQSSKICTAVLVHPKFVLTQASCLLSQPIDHSNPATMMKLGLDGLKAFLPKSQEMTFTPGFLGFGLNDFSSVKVKNIHLRDALVIQGNRASDMALVELDKALDLPVAELVSSKTFKQTKEGEIVALGLGFITGNDVGLLLEKLRYSQYWDIKWFFAQDIIQLDFTPFPYGAGTFMTVFNSEGFKVVGLQVDQLNTASPLGKLTDEFHPIVSFFNDAMIKWINQTLASGQGK